VKLELQHELAGKKKCETPPGTLSLKYLTGIKFHY